MLRQKHACFANVEGSHVEMDATSKIRLNGGLKYPSTPPEAHPRLIAVQAV